MNDRCWDPQRRRWLGAALLAATSPGVWAQGPAWPQRPIKLVVGFPAGSSPDAMARTLSGPLAERLGQPVVVDNRPGAAGNIAADAVARATDGHTLGLMINGNLTIAKILNPATPYDPLTDLAPVSLLATAPLVLCAGPAVQAHGAGVLAAARAAGAQWNYGTPGVGTVAHIGMEMIQARAGWRAVHVPFAGNPQVIQAMLRGEVHLALLPPGLAIQQSQAGKLQAVAVTSAGRSSLAPGLPTLGELGVSDVQLEIWNAVAAPRSMPAAHIARVATALAAITREPAVRERLFQQGWQVAGTAPEGLARRIQIDTERMRAVIERLGLRTG
ncbi:MAG: tripartite tricarboxylate transporter substrate-binding protein [Pseudomonadota bacterium]